MALPARMNFLPDHEGEHSAEDEGGVHDREADQQLVESFLESWIAEDDNDANVACDKHKY